MRQNVVCLFTSREYYPLAYVLASRLAASPARTYDIIIFTEATDLPAPPGVSLQEFPLADAVPATAASSARIPRLAYYRLFMAEALPERYKRAVYLDGDITLKGDLEALFAIDLKGHPLAGVADCGFVKRRDTVAQAKWVEYLRSIHIDPERLYINAGVLLADLAAWRRMAVSTKASDYLREVGGRLTGMDQDTLNFVFSGDVLELSPRWNFQALYFGCGLEEALHPVVYHHLDTVKPWHDLIYPTNEFSAEYAAMFANSPWPDFVRNAREPWHRKRALKWRARRAFRFLPSVAKRFKAEDAKRRDWRALALPNIAAKLANGAYGDINPAESARLAASVEALMAAGAHPQIGIR